MTLLEALTAWRNHQAAKHEFEPGRTERDINALSNYEFLTELSEALETAGVMPPAPDVPYLPPLNN